ncbi:MAG: hypothetical protein QOI98_3439 [Solirubrobacteraceae bacterium]|jgi:hypothetical protein|nr:hypothetical protein [Solirubrobacteraceae bacterium]
MTLSVLMYAMMMTTLVVLVGVLVVDAVGDVLSWYARRSSRFRASRPTDDGPAHGVRSGRSAAAPQARARSAHR